MLETVDFMDSNRDTDMTGRVYLGNDELAKKSDKSEKQWLDCKSISKVSA
ncbi:hypothetical protein [Sphingobacterium corticis]